MTTIYVSDGMKRYVGGTITETTGKDLSAATFAVGLGTADPRALPEVWLVPDVDTEGATPASRVVKMLVDAMTEPGTYYCWARITDSPEVEPVRFDDRLEVV